MQYVQGVVCFTDAKASEERGRPSPAYNLRQSVLKPFGAHWLISLYSCLKEYKSIIVNGFKAAGLGKA